MLQLKAYKILVYNDTPQLFLAKDQVGTIYLCMTIESTTLYEEYFAIPISSKKLNALVNGKIDLRAAFQTSETGVWYKVKASETNDFIADAIIFDVVDEKYLPLEGFILPEFETVPSKRKLKNGRTRITVIGKYATVSYLDY